VFFNYNMKLNNKQTETIQISNFNLVYAYVCIYPKLFLTLASYNNNNSSNNIQETVQ
jgi:hypothetical protein